MTIRPTPKVRVVVAAVIGAVALALVGLRVARPPTPQPPLPTDGPLVGLSVTSGGQDVPHPGPIFSAGMAMVADLDRHPVRIVSAAAWDGAHLVLSEAYYATGRTENDAQSFLGGVPDPTFKAAATHDHLSKWIDAAPLVGAQIQPCCSTVYFLGLGFTPQLPAPAGRTLGVTITYQTSTGLLYRSFVAIEMGYCAGTPTTPACQAEAHLEGQQIHRTSQGAPADDALHRPGSWHGG